MISSGQPRVTAAGTTMHDDHYLFYVASDGNCGDAASWQSAPLFPRGSGAEVAYDVAIDGQGRPRVAYTVVEYDATGNNPVHSLFCLLCRSGCQSANGKWQHLRVETTAHVQAAWPAGYPAACADGSWSLQVPTLALGPGDAPRVAGDAVYAAGCEFDPSSGRWQAGDGYTYSAVWRAVRVVVFPAP